MSYSRPLFVPIAVRDSRLAEKYRLHLFRQGGLDPLDKLTGVPALFIPGHAGSYKQARSIAAEVAEVYQNQFHGDVHYASLDMFTVDLNEEFTALHGGLILDQAEYLNDAIAQILLLYQHQRLPGRPLPASVLIVGHSMGGIVARIMPCLPNYKDRTINTILTLATPHATPPVILDDTMLQLYQMILPQQGYPNDTAVISIAGGSLDTIVNSDTVALPVLPTTWTAFATGIPHVWTGCDHMAILWCNQLVKKVAAMLVEITDPSSPWQTRSIDQRMGIIRKHLSHSPHVQIDGSSQRSPSD
ncbi:PGAP1-domain-containing protein [Hesseltinella vesiculosa]|uniref:GPI inositol-deacylase n=1 Tax=Hesseltinella vesiculosa TaxID=101127 RepID=A0A1X2GKT4_9FUNG|nr:PGAP1-domain-containing protein [Hesseltinella vesiculosa]